MARAFGRHRGVSFIEMGCFASIFGLLVATVVWFVLSEVGNSAAEGKVRADIDAIKKAVALYKLDVGVHPRGLVDLSRAPAGVRRWKGPYVAGELTDPWGQPYVYASQTSDAFDVFSRGEPHSVEVPSMAIAWGAFALVVVAGLWAFWPGQQLSARPLLVVSVRTIATRCAFCHDALASDASPCRACATVLHRDCWIETLRCPSLGCVGTHA